MIELKPALIWIKYLYYKISRQVNTKYVKDKKKRNNIFYTSIIHILHIMKLLKYQILY